MPPPARPLAALIGDFSSSSGNLELSYERALKSLGWQVERFEIARAVERHGRLGRAGRLLHAYLPIPSWTRKGNRDLAVELRHAEPQLVMVYCHCAVSAGALAQVVASTGAKLVLVWQDPLVNLADHVVAALPLYDLVACYSRAAVPALERLGARAAAWVPLAADPHLHARASLRDGDDAEYGCDVSFIGNWRPEREATLAALCAQGRWSVKIWGGATWRDEARDPAVRKAWQGRLVLGAEFSRASLASKVCLNIIDELNYPAANMRLFEIPSTGALELSSACPELSDELCEGEHAFYYDSHDELWTALESLLADDELRRRVAAAGREKVLAAHTYQHRARQILGRLGWDPTPPVRCRVPAVD